MNGFLELELWRIIGQGPDKNGGGYSGSGRGSLGHKSYTKRILYLVVAIVVVEQDMAVVKNLFQWRKYKSMGRRTGVVRRAWARVAAARVRDFGEGDDE
ncbi:hypothetical protein GOBAR_AA00142 [Gossypium barbadense]|uniref:Uncharacterized protein n=1 Tax=Gossypium barbadense TaxID=3634 RepID=A0A2P5YXW8_GOSBA|nr:hypothetical protein GOBAR_AA00142 [Gossypium barbadense]